MAFESKVLNIFRRFYVMISKLRNLMTTFNIIQPGTGQKISFCQLAKDLTENRKLVYFSEIHSTASCAEQQQSYPNIVSIFPVV